jgi:hypothetical protein
LKVIHRHATIPPPSTGAVKLPISASIKIDTRAFVSNKLRDTLNGKMRASFAWNAKGNQRTLQNLTAAELPSIDKPIFSIPEQGQSPVFIPPVGGANPVGAILQPVARLSNFTKGQDLPPVASGSMDESGSTPEAVFQPGSIFAPGEVWGQGSRPNDFPEDTTTVGDTAVPASANGPGILDQSPTNGDEQMAAFDWGDILGNTALDIGRELLGNSGLINNFSGGQVPVGGVGLPAEVVVNTRTGETKRCPRRRRRRLLTPTDLSDLAALQALVGKGSSALNMAVAKAVRR